MTTPHREMEDLVRAVFAAQTPGVDEQARRSPLADGPGAAFDEPTDTAVLHWLDPTDGPGGWGHHDRPRRRRRLHPFLAAAAALMVLAGAAVAVSGAGGGAQNTGPSDSVAVDTGPALVLPGETVLSADPLVVQAPLGSEPAFDTTGLGAELRFDPVISLDDPAVRNRLETLAAEIDEMRIGLPDAAGLTVPKVTIEGWLDGKLWLETVADRPLPVGEPAAPDATVQRYSWVSFEDGSAVLETPGAAVDGGSTAGIAPPDDGGEIFGRGVAGAFPTGPIYVSRLPADVSVVSYTDADQRWWIRPRGGVAAFPATVQRIETYTIRAYAADGTVLAEVSGDDTLDNTGPTYRAEPGEALLAVPTFDEQGRPIEITGRGRPLILVYGASWCAPCQRGIAEATAAIDALGDSVDVYAVPFQTNGEDPWPQIDTWHHPRIRFDATTAETHHEDGVATPLDVAWVPTVLVVGADGVVMASLGFDDLAAKLAELGLGPAGNGG